MHQNQKGILGPQAIWPRGLSAPNGQKEKKNKRRRHEPGEALPHPAPPSSPQPSPPLTTAGSWHSSPACHPGPRSPCRSPRSPGIGQFLGTGPG